MLDPEVAQAVLELKHDPIALDEFLFSREFSLAPHQRHIFREIDNHPFTFLQACRAAGKSYSVARYLNNYCLRFPRTRVIISGPSYRQSRIPWRMAKDIIFNESWFDWDDFLVREPTESTEESRIMFRNRSEIIALPASGTKLHGKRGQVLVLTEFFEYPQVLYGMTVLPMLAKRMSKDRDNKVIWETTAGFEFQFAYQEYKRVCEEVEKNNPKYSLVSIPIDVLLRSGWEMEMDIVEATRKIDQDTYYQQYENRWLSDSGSFHLLSIMMQEELKTTEILLQGRPKKEYVMSLDTARSRRGTGDDSALAVIEVGEKPEIVYLWSTNNITAEDLAAEVLRRLKWFENTIMLVVDYRGGGEYVVDELYRSGIVEIAPEHTIPGRRLIQPFSSTPEEINRGHQEIRGAFENGMVRLPKRPDADDADLFHAYREIDQALKQLADLQITRLPSGYMRFEPPPGRMRDKAYALMYAFWGVQRILESRMQAAVETIDLGDPAVSSDFAEVLFGS